MRPLSPRMLTNYYIFALLLIALLSIFSHLILEKVLKTNQGSAAVINISGRQRMLSQRIASLAAQYRLGDGTTRNELISAIHTFDITHQKLLIENKVGKNNNESQDLLHKLYYSGSTPLDMKVNHFIANANKIAALPSTSSLIPPLLTELFSAAREPLLHGLDQVVLIHQQESEHRLEELWRVQWIILTIVLLTLILEALTIFRPMIKRVFNYTTELLRLATTDSLTGVHNRRSFLEKGEMEYQKAHRHNQPTSLIMLDADDFKKINDKYGHSAGDEVLKLLAQSIHLHLRPMDILGRIGREEFAIVLPNLTLSDSQVLAERLRRMIESLRVNHTIAFTVSFGVTVITTNIEEALRLADTALYKAKDQGRNCVVTATP